MGNDFCTTPVRVVSRKMQGPAEFDIGLPTIGGSGVECRPSEETPAERGARMLREARASQPACSAAVAKWFSEMGITAKPIGAEKLQEMMAVES